ncbi:MAG: FIST C-terminal domain-containing protein [Chloroflexia bacterium]|jgi:small ligand-binding sensory domain FIST|nr:FIST C-terminal domain-containing protein [Chloroflexia bacterium]
MRQDHEIRRTSYPSAGTEPWAARSAAVATGSWKLAVDLVVADLHAGSPPDRAPDLLFVFASDRWSDHFGEMLADLRRRTGATTMIGGSASGVLADHLEHECVPALSCLALWLPGVIADLLRLHQESLPLLDVPETWHATTGVDPDQARGVILLADPFRMDAHLLVRGMSRCYPNTPIVGGMTSGANHDRRTWTFLDEQVYDEGGVALVLTGPVRLTPMVSQGCEPVGEPWTITRADRNTILEISNRPALDVLLDTARAVGASIDRESLPFGDWMIGFAIDEYRDRFDRGDFVIRGMLGGDMERKGIVVGGVPRVGQTVQFQMRDPGMAGVDLHQHLVDLRAALTDTPPVAGLLFTCNGRGKKLFGRQHHDTESVGGVFRSLPLAGMFCNGEIGPGGRREGSLLHGFTATLAMIVPDKAPATNT